MLTVIYDEEEEVFKAKGTFKLGIQGVYENKSFDDEVISIDEEILENIQEGDEEFVGPSRCSSSRTSPRKLPKGLRSTSISLKSALPKTKSKSMTAFCTTSLRIWRAAVIRSGV